MSPSDRKLLHNFLLQPKSRNSDINQDILILREMLRPYGCSITLWEHAILLEIGIDVFAGANMRLIPTRRGYRLQGMETDSLVASMANILEHIHKYANQK
jgi:hypothetical protein